MMLSQYTQALEDARASVSLDAAFVKGYVRIAKCCLTLGDAASAGQALDKASEVEPKNAAVMQVRPSANGEQYRVEQKNPAKFGDACAVRADRLCIGCLG